MEQIEECQGKARKGEEETEEIPQIGTPRNGKKGRLKSRKVHNQVAENQRRNRGDWRMVKLMKVAKVREVRKFEENGH
jgi:hypothetical protein